MRSDLRLSTLRERTQVRSKLMNVKVPDTLDAALRRAVKELGCTKTAAAPPATAPRPRAGRCARFDPIRSSPISL